MKTNLNCRYLFFIFIILQSYFSYSQICDLIDSEYFGDETPSDVIDIWKASGAEPFKSSTPFHIATIIDVSQPPHNIEPGVVGGQIAYLLDNLSPSSLSEQTMVYFPAGIYILGNSINIPSFVILKGVSGNPAAIEHTTFQFAFNDPQFIPNNLISMNGDYSAIEDISLYDFGPDSNDDNKGDMVDISGSNCWLRGVESRYTSRFHVNIYGSNITISGCYFHHAHSYGTGGNAYGVCLNDDAYACRIEDNIFRKLRHSINLQDDPSYNVIAYNYCREKEISHLADLNFHGKDDQSIGPNYNLCEGNYVEYIRLDKYHGENGPYNVIMRNYAGRFNISTKQDFQNQYKQNIIGTNATPQDDSEQLINTHGYYEYWHSRPNWSNIPSDQATYYQELDYNQVPREKPSFYYNTVSWRFPWPCLPGDLTPAKYRFDRNNGYYLTDPPTTEVVHAGWDIYDICGLEDLYYTDGSYVSNLEDDFVAMNEIIIGPYHLQSNNTVSFKAKERVTIFPDFSVAAIDDNYLFISSGDPCNNSESKGEKFSNMAINLTSYSYDNFGIEEKSKISEIIGKSQVVSDVSEFAIIENDFSIFPNPNNGVFSISFDTSCENISVSLYNINGSLILHKDKVTNNKLTIDVRDKQKGIYLIYIILNGLTKSQKIIIN